MSSGMAGARAAAKGDPLLEAMIAELERSKSGLKMDQVQAPYYVEYRLSEIEGYGVEAAFGALRDEQKFRVRYLRAVVRVGDYKQDSYFGQGAGASEVMPLDDDPLALRHQMWLVTDQAYKAASEALTAKQAMLKQFNVDQPVDDFAHAPVLQSVGPLVHLEYSPEHWRKVLEDATNLYRKYPDVQSVEGSVRFTAINEYFVNTEGTVTREGHATYALVLSSATQAPDGMRLERSPYYMMAKPEELPSDAKISADAVKMLDTIVRLRQAPIVEEEYRGPVLFYADAADDVFAGLVGSNVLGRKPQPGHPARTTGQYATSFKSRVLPDFVTIVDDPTMKEFQGHSLVGSYDVDSEGVKAAPVTVVDKGQLINYLLGREPIRDFPESNGHARAAFGAGPTPSTANLVVRAEKSSSLNDLKKQMMEMCRNQGRPYGYYVETLGPGMAPRLLYRIWEKDGREELVRGAVFNELDVRTLRNNLAAAGNDPLVSNRLGGLPTTVISPSVLFDELEVKRADASKDKLPEYPPPPLTNPR
ncbi:MAG TPA: metallopeptidase TldD-related protein [Candidatus Acidoferrales bacterium]|nr:metallopeptidase TldD-related protein [Candidatus Acidoferrales bacterium]